MKYIVTVIISIVILGLGAAASAAPKPFYCGTTAYDKAYAAVYEYPTGSYWQAQIAAYPAYYKANNAFYQSNYGC